MIHPRISWKRLVLTPVVVLTLVGLNGQAQGEIPDAPPVQVEALLKELKLLSDKHGATSKQTRGTALQAASTAMANSDKAIQFWAESVGAIQFSAATPKDNPAFKEWMEKEGEALNHAACRSALRLYFTWMSLTLQRAGGTPVKDLVPQISAYVKDLIADQEAIEAVEESARREKEKDHAPKKGNVMPVQHKKVSDEMVKRAHDSILKRGLGASPVVQYWKIGPLLAAESWEGNPGSVDAIYESIMMPYLRENRDLKALDFWDYKLQRESAVAEKSRSVAEQDRFMTVKRPSLLWRRAEELAWLGYKNRAINEMMGLIRSNPTHPDFQVWVGYVSGLVGGSARPAGDPAASGVPSGVPQSQ